MLSSSTDIFSSTRAPAPKYFIFSARFLLIGSACISYAPHNWAAHFFLAQNHRTKIKKGEKKRGDEALPLISKQKQDDLDPFLKSKRRNNNTKWERKKLQTSVENKFPTNAEMIGLSLFPIASPFSLCFYLAHEPYWERRVPRDSGERARASRPFVDPSPTVWLRRLALAVVTGPVVDDLRGRRSWPRRRLLVPTTRN